MKRKPKYHYKPLDKIIVTHEFPAYIAYVVADRKGNIALLSDTIFQLRIARHLQDAQEHRYKFIRYQDAHPYSDELWNACLRLEEKHKELQSYFADLRKGKIPDALRPIVQGGLFAVMQDRT